MNRAFRVSEALESGQVTINSWGDGKQLRTVLTLLTEQEYLPFYDHSINDIISDG